MLNFAIINMIHIYGKIISVEKIDRILDILTFVISKEEGRQSTLRFSKTVNYSIERANWPPFSLQTISVSALRATN